MFFCDFSADPVCIPEEYVEAKQNVYGLRNGNPAEPAKDVLARTGAKIVNLFSDAVRRETPAGLSQICEQDVCVHYLKSCNVSIFTCRYVIGVQRNPPDAKFQFVPREFMLEAKSAEALSRAQNALQLGSPGASNVIRLSQLSDEVSKPDLEKHSAWHIG